MWGALKDLTSLVTAIGVIALGVINITSSSHAKKVGAQAVAAAQNQAIAAEKQAGEMNVIREEINGHLTAIMHEKWIVIERLAAKDPTPENIADAQKAKAQYEQRVVTMKAKQASNAKAKAEVDAKQDVPIPK